jgi:LysM repeat protein
MYPFKTATLLTALLLGMGTATALRAEMSLYIVAPGDTLWSIASENLKSPHDWRRLMEFNNMTEQSQLKVDQELRIPMEWLNSSFAPVAAANRPADLPPVALAPARLEKARAPSAATAARDGAKSVKGVAAISSSAHAVATTYGLVERLNGALRTTLAPNDTLLEQSRVSTGKQSGVNIRLRDGSMVVLLSESEVELSQPLKLVRGALEYAANNGAERRLVSAAAGEVKGQQAHFRVTSLKDGRQLLVEVERGMISVAANGEQRAMSAGLAMLVESGQPLSEPHQGVMRPDVSNLSKGGVNGQVNLSWPPISDAAGYRAQLVYAADAYLVLLDEKVNQPRLAWNNISPGLYKIRLRSIDNRGLEGLNAEFPFVVQGALAAPRSNSPLDGATLPTNTPWIAWSRVEEANSYTLQVARDATFKTGLQEYSYLVNSYYKYGDALPAGNYYWRVMSISRKQEKSGFGDVRMFRIK